MSEAMCAPEGARVDGELCDLDLEIVAGTGGKGDGLGGQGGGGWGRNLGRGFGRGFSGMRLGGLSGIRMPKISVPKIR